MRTTLAARSHERGVSPGYDSHHHFLALGVRTCETILMGEAVSLFNFHRGKKIYPPAFGLRCFSKQSGPRESCFRPKRQPPPSH